LAFGDYGHKEGDETVYTDEELAEANALSRNPDAILELLHRKDADGEYLVTLDALDDFLDNHAQARNVLIPQTYTYFHQ